MNKEKFMKLIRAKEERKKELAEKSDKATTVEELRSIGEEIKRINGEVEELRGIIADDQSSAVADRTKAVNEKGAAAKQDMFMITYFA